MKKTILGKFLVVIAIVVSSLLFTQEADAQLVPASCRTGSCTICEFFELISNIINFMISLGGALALLGVIVGGLRYMTAGSNPTLLSKAKDTLKNTGVGLLITIGGWLIITTTLQVLSADQNQGSWFHIQCSTIEIQSGSSTGTVNTNTTNAPALLKDKEFKSISKYTDQINQAAKTANIDPCVVATIIRKESYAGDSNTIGNDAAFHAKRQFGNNSPQHKEALGFNQFDKTNPPLYGLKWDCEKCSWGFGLTQITIFPDKTKWQDQNTPAYYDPNSKKWYNPVQLLDPQVSIQLGAYHFREKLGKSQSLKEAFGRYNGGADWQSKPSSVTYADDAMRIYNICAKERGSNLPSADPVGGYLWPLGFHKGQNCSKIVGNQVPDPSCGLKQGAANAASYETTTKLPWYMVPAVHDDFVNMANAFQAQFPGRKIYILGKAWRSQRTQYCLYDNKPDVAGKPRKGLTSTNLPTTTAHQSGMSVDIGLSRNNDCPSSHNGTQFLSFNEWSWLFNNASRFNFRNLAPRMGRNKGFTLKEMYCSGRSEAWHFDSTRPSSRLCPSVDDNVQIQKQASR